MQHPQHHENVEEHKPSTECERYDEQKEYTEVVAYLEDGLAVLVRDEIREHPHDEVKRQQSERGDGQVHTEEIEHADQAREDDDPSDVECVAFEDFLALELDGLRHTVVAEEYPEEDQRDERDISEAEPVEE